MTTIEHEVARYERHYGGLFKEMREDWEQLRRAGKIARAEELETETGEPFVIDEPPQYFVGDLDASFVLVHLNPKEDTRPGSKAAAGLPRDDFNAYVYAQRWFGKQHYGAGTGRWKSRFDHKQVQFLAPFGVIDFAGDIAAGEPACRLDLERVIDDKLQLELIPYASPTFRTGRLARAESLLSAHFARVLDVITARQREYVIFCGVVFDRLLEPHVVARDDYSFRLIKADGTPMRQQSRFTKVTLQTSNGPLEAGIAHAFTRQGLPMPAYALEVQAACVGRQPSVGA